MSEVKSGSLNFHTKIIVDQFIEWCEHTTIHGVKYLGERGRFIVERLCWIIVFVVSFTICGNLIHNLWLKWNNSPAIVSFSEVPTVIWDIPFPAVTICPEYKYRLGEFNTTRFFNSSSGEKKLFQIELNDLNLDEMEKEDIINREIALSTICFNEIEDQSIDYLNQNHLELLSKMALQVNNTLEKSSFRGKPYDPSTLFREVLTEEGICFSFNFMDFKDIFRADVVFNYTRHGRKTVDWSLEHGYSENAKIDSFPFRSFNSGLNEALRILMQLNAEDKSHFCQTAMRGYKVILHLPTDIPRMEGFFWVPSTSYQMVYIKPKVITTAKSLRKYDPFKRYCLFESEKYLKFFKIYTRSNCEFECLINKTFEVCGCVSFHMPKTSDMKICGPNKYECQDRIAALLVENNYKESRVKLNHFPCDCLPDCTSISYDMEVSDVDIDWTVLHQNQESVKSRIAFLEVFFKSNYFISSERSELYGMTDLIANIGGLLGLFMGVSALSIIEIVYFVTLRLICNIKLRRNIKNSLQDEALKN